MKRLAGILAVLTIVVVIRTIPAQAASYSNVLNRTATSATVTGANMQDRSATSITPQQAADYVSDGNNNSGVRMSNTSYMEWEYPSIKTISRWNKDVIFYEQCYGTLRVRLYDESGTVLGTYTTYYGYSGWQDINKTGVKKIRVDLSAGTLFKAGEIVIEGEDGQVLDPPANLRVTEATVNQIAVAWDAADGAESYKTYLDGTYKATVTGTEYTFTNLTPGKSYTIGVTSVAGGAETSATEISQQTAVLTAPTNLQVTAHTTSSISLSWTAGTGAKEYKVYINGTLAATVTATSIDLTDLLDGESYQIGVKSYADGSYSTAATVTAATDPAAPLPPENLTATDVTSDSAKLTWTASSSHDVTGYEILYRGSSVGTTTGTQWPLTRLTPGYEYTYSVRTLDNDELYSTSVQVTFSTLEEVPPPQPPGNFRVLSVTDKSADLEWSTIPGVAGYRLWANGVWVTDVGQQGTYTVTGLTPSTEYMFGIAAFNLAQEYSPTAYCTGTTNPPVPEKITGLSLDSQGVNTVSIYWTPDPVALGYRVYVNGHFAKETTAASLTLTGVGGYCSITVSGFNVTGEGPESDPLGVVVEIPEIPPTPPRHLKVSAYKLGFWARWDPPQVAADYYRVYADGQIVEETTNLYWRGDMGWESGSSHYIEVEAVNEYGQARSEPVTLTVVAIVPLDPEDVTPPVLTTIGGIVPFLIWVTGLFLAFDVASRLIRWWRD